MIKKIGLKYLIIISHAIIITIIYICAIVFPVSSDEPVSFLTRLIQIVIIILGASSATGLIMNKKLGKLIGIVLYSFLLFQSSKLIVIALRADRMFVEVFMSVLFVLMLCFPLALLMTRDKKIKTNKQHED